MSDIRTTEFEVEYELIDVDAAEDAEYVVTNAQPFSTPSLLSEGESTSPYITLEHNFSIMDGSLHEFPDVPKIGFVSKYKSNSLGQWSQAKAPTIEILFDDVHSSLALTFGLMSDMPLQVSITWYQGPVVLASGTYDIDSKGMTGEPVEQYDRVVITFVQTIPDRYVKLYNVIYGTRPTWDETTIKNATMTKDIDIVSELLPSDVLNFELVDITFGDLNLGNDLGIHRFFQKNQPMHCYEWLNDDRIPVGKFFLKTYEHESNIGKFSCVSYIDRMDEIAFNEGALYNGVSAGVILEQIFKVAGIKSYSIDSGTYSQKLYGTLKPQSCRNALREVLFACQSIVDTSDANTVYVRKTSDLIKGTIGRDIKFSTRAKKTEYISGVEVEYLSYKKLDEESPIANDMTFEKGTHLLIFDGPYDASSITFSSMSAINILATSTYYVKFTAGIDVTISIYGKGYIEASNKVSKSNELEAGRFLNIKKFVSTLSDYNNAKRLVDILLEYFSLDMEISIKALAMDVDMEHRYIVENDTAQYSDYIGSYSSRTFDLTGGFISNATLKMTFVTDANKSYFIKDPGEEEMFVEDTDTVII